MSSDIEKIKSRIRKLLNMAGDSSSPNEAAIAAERAAKLMRKYQLDQADVIEEELRNPDSMKAERWGKSYIAQPIWMQSLCIAVARVTETIAGYGAVIDENHRARKIIEFRGYGPDVDLAHSLATYLLQQIDLLADREMARCKADGGIDEYNASPYIYMTSYRQGLSSTVCQSLREFYRLETAEAGATGQALVVAKHNAVRDTFGKERYGRTRAGGTTQSATAKGVRDGREVSVAPAVEGKSRHTPGLLF